MTGAFGLAVEGKLSAATKAIGEGLKKAATGAMRDTAAPIKGRLRADILRGFRDGTRLSKTWRVDVYPRAGTSADPAMVIGNRAGDLIEIFGAGVTIHSAHGDWLAVPSPAMYARLITSIRRTLRGQFTSFRSSKFYWPEKAAELLGAADGPKFWIAPGGRHGTIYVKVGKDRQIIGWLVKQTVLGKRIEGVALLNKIEAELPFLYETRFTEYLDAEMSGL